MSITLSQLFSQLDLRTNSIPLDVLANNLSTLDVDFELLRPYARFGHDRYQRNLIHAGPAYQALLLCWRSGQRSPIHDHRGSACGLRVLKGVCTETVFKRNADGFIIPTVTREKKEGTVCATFDADIHQISNLQPRGQDLITLHIYSPPLLVMGTYSLTDNRVREFIDPIHEFSHGAGI